MSLSYWSVGSQARIVKFPVTPPTVQVTGNDDEQAAEYAAAVFNATLGKPLTIEVLRGVFALRVLSAR
jgi:hypothetical protein